jgi:hypothetical protein
MICLLLTLAQYLQPQRPHLPVLLPSGGLSAASASARPCQPAPFFELPHQFPADASEAHPWPPSYHAWIQL